MKTIKFLFAVLFSIAVVACGGGNGGSSANGGSSTPATYSISGTVSGAASSGVTITLGGDNTGSVVTGVGGAYTISGLAFGNYTVTPSLSGSTFSPTNIAVMGQIPFEHNDSSPPGTLGTVSLGSVIWSAQDVSAFFQIVNLGDGRGTIRARRTDEISAPLLALYTNMWTTGGTVVVTFNHDFGSDTINIQLGTYPAITVSGPQIGLNHLHPGGF